MSTAARPGCLHSMSVGRSRSTRAVLMGWTQAQRRSGPTAATTWGYGGAGPSLPSLPVSTPREKSFFLTGSFPFPRGFAFGLDGDLYLASGVGPSGQGDNTIAVFNRQGALRTPHLVDDPELSPLDLALAPNGNIVVSSEWPFGAEHATASVREYDQSTGQLVRVLAPDPALGFARPRGLRFGSDGRLFCVGQDHIIAFNFSRAPTSESPCDSEGSTATLLFFRTEDLAAWLSRASADAFRESQRRRCRMTRRLPEGQWDPTKIPRIPILMSRRAFLSE
jgi:hypothetical protein